MTELEALPNLGPALAAALRAAGIDDAEQLREVGSERAWVRVHPRFDCLHSLLALEAAVQGIPKRELDEATRLRLKQVYAGYGA